LREAGAPLLTGLREQEVATVIGRRGFAVGGYDFIVTIPPGVDATRAAAATREFKLASKRFIIVIE
jgi:hypothetical protein